MNKLVKLSVLAAATLTASHAFAAAPKWDLVEVSYVNSNFDSDFANGDFEPDGFAFAGSKLLNDNFYLTGSYTSLSDEINRIDFDLDFLNLGFGYRTDLTANTDWYATVSYVRADAETSNGGSEDDNVVGLSTGVRSMLSDNFELLGEVSHIDTDGSETTFRVGAYYYLNNNFALSTGFATSNHRTTWNLGLRYAF